MVWVTLAESVATPVVAAVSVRYSKVVVVVGSLEAGRPQGSPASCRGIACQGVALSARLVADRGPSYQEAYQGSHWEGPWGPYPFQRGPS